MKNKLAQLIFIATVFLMLFSLTSTINSTGGDKDDVIDSPISELNL